MIKARPKVKSSSAMWPLRWTRRGQARSGARALHLAGGGLVDILGQDGGGHRPAQAGLLGVVFHPLAEGADEILADDLVVVLAHGGVEAEEILARHALHGEGHL